MQRKRSGGFTLIELLVVIAIIALLMGILLPALGRARENGRTTVCLSQMQQINTAGLQYAMELNQDRTWDANVWLRQDNDPRRTCDADSRGLKPGLLYEYVESADEILACPKGKRQQRPQDDGRLNMFSSGFGLDTDYTVPGNTAGLDINKTIITKRTEQGNLGQFVIPGSPTEARLTTTMSGPPLFAEESAWWYNGGVTDAKWQNADKLTPRHERGGHVSYADGSVERITTTQVFREEEEQSSLFLGDPTTFGVGHIYYWGMRLGAPMWIQNPVVGPTIKYGWINRPNSIVPSYVQDRGCP